jgi:hypothetical protein
MVSQWANSDVRNWSLQEAGKTWYLGYKPSDKNANAFVQE